MARQQLAPPFTEKILTYATDDFPFLPHIRCMLSCEDESKSLDCLHEAPTKAQLRGSLMNHVGFRNAYHNFVKDYLRKHLEEEILVFESSPNLRIHYAHSKFSVGPHTDGDYGHSPYEINFWVPLTVATGTASLFAESSPGQGDFHSFEAQYGDAVRFYGSRCLHFTRDNNTDCTRVSFDFRIVKFSDFFVSGIPLHGNSRARSLFSYYDVMGPNGIISEDHWASLAQGTIVTTHPYSGMDKMLETAEIVSLETAEIVSSKSLPGRTRSPSCEHHQRCVNEWGSERAARTNCARCSWLQHRPPLLQSLVYMDRSGNEVPWLAENPDQNAPWGLGCVICNAAQKKGLNNQVTAFSQFTFASGPSGVLCGYQPLFRHGNCARKQHQRGDSRPRLAFDEGHQIALREFGARDIEGTPMQQSMEHLRTEMTTFKDEVRVEVNNVKSKVSKVEDTLKLQGVRMKEFEAKLNEGAMQNSSGIAIDEELRKRVDEIESTFTQGLLTLPKSINTLVIGGLKVSYTAAVQWVNKISRDSRAAAPIDTYKKSRPEDPFKGVMFLKFRNIQEAENTLLILKDEVARENVGKDGQHRIWCDFEFPIEKRLCDGFLTDLRKQLLEWNFPKECIEVDKELGFMKVEGAMVVKVDVKGQEFDVQWVNAAWANCGQLQSSEELRAIKGKAVGRLAKSKARISKSLGKDLSDDANGAQT